MSGPQRSRRDGDRAGSACTRTSLGLTGPIAPGYLFETGHIGTWGGQRRVFCCPAARTMSAICRRPTGMRQPTSNTAGTSMNGEWSRRTRTCNAWQFSGRARAAATTRARIGYRHAADVGADWQARLATGTWTGRRTRSSPRPISVDTLCAHQACEPEDYGDRPTGSIMADLRDRHGRIKKRCTRTGDERAVRQRRDRQVGAGRAYFKHYVEPRSPTRYETVIGGVQGRRTRPAWEDCYEIWDAWDRF